MTDVDDAAGPDRGSPTGTQERDSRGSDAGNGLAAAFRDRDRPLLIGYWPAGYPDTRTSIRMIEAMVDGGADVVEVGLPYSDPVLDGPTIAAAGRAALAAGTRTRDVLDVVSAAAATGATVAIMSYWNLIEQYGPPQFARDLAGAGGVGAITPDLPVEEADEWISACDEWAVGRSFLAAPSSSDARLRRVADASSGFVYASAVMGVTGARASLSDAADELVARVRPVAHTPIAVGLGVSTGQQAARVAEYADGVIVGSAFVRCLPPGGDAGAAAVDVRELAAELATGVRRHT